MGFAQNHQKQELLESADLPRRILSGFGVQIHMSLEI